MLKTSPTFKQNWKDLLSVGGLVGAVLGTLILGAALQAESPTGDGRPSRTVIERPTHAATEFPAPAAPPVERPLADSRTSTADRPAEPIPSDDVDAPELAGEDDRLARRAMLDPRRLASSAGGWTLQFMFTCLPETAEQVVDELADDMRLHLLPMLQDDQACFRICWGSYSTREQALAATDIPTALLQLTREPLPRPIDDLLR